MKIMLLGATGRTGRKVMSELLERGHSVRVLVRDEAILPVEDRLECLTGNDIKELISGESLNGVDAVLDVLNISRTNDFPWAPVRTPATFLSDVMQTLIQNMNASHVTRLVVTSAWGANESRTEVPGWFRWLIDHSNVGVAYRDHERQEGLLTASKLDWTIVRPVGLINTEKVRPTEMQSGGKRPASLTVSRLELANCLVDLVEQRQFVREIVTLSRR